jgi:hypothetical protein
MSFSFNQNNLGHDAIVPRRGDGRLRLAKAAIRARCEGICQNYPNRCPAQPESCSILKGVATTRAEVRRDCQKISLHIHGTAKYNKPLEKVKKNLGRGFPAGNLPGTRFSAYFSAFSRADRRDL